jgi:proline iminopeptidase
MAVGDGHILHVEECGPVDGLPVLFLHDGLGEGCRPEHCRLFDPQRFRVILIDPRGVGRSLPRGELTANTTPDLVGDLEHVRDALGIQRWIIVGSGWGCLLALAYAQLFIERIGGLVLSSVFMGSRQEVKTLLQAPPGGFDADWQRLAGFVPPGEREDLLDAYARRILGDDPQLAGEASRAWLNYVAALQQVLPGGDFADDTSLAQARLQMHYLQHGCFIAPGQLLAGVDRLRHLPAAIVQGLADPLWTTHSAEALHRAWPEATWFPVANAGHGILAPAVAKACSKALGWVAECVETVG